MQLTGLGGPGTGSGNGTGTGSGADTTAPALSALSIVKRPRPTRKKGATLRLTLSEAASVQVTVERLLRGRRAGGTCKAKGTGKRCQRAVKVASFSAPLAAGAQTIKLTRKQLATGTLRITLLATDAAGNRSPHPPSRPPCASEASTHGAGAVRHPHHREAAARPRPPGWRSFRRR